MIQVLCYSCHTYLANTDVARLDWPMSGEMFDVVYPGWSLRPGQLNLEVWCPACGQFPFSHDPYTHGGSAVGKNLNIRGADGKASVMTIKQILLGQLLDLPSSPDQTVLVVDKLYGPPSPKPAFPCPSCGAKKRFHKKGCPTQPCVEVPVAKAQMSDPHLTAMESRVSRGPDQSVEPTPEEIKAVARERENRRERPEPVLRPGEGYSPKAVG